MICVCVCAWVCVDALKAPWCQRRQLFLSCRGNQSCGITRGETRGTCFQNQLIVTILSPSFSSDAILIITPEHCHWSLQLQALAICFKCYGKAEVKNTVNLYCSEEWARNGSLIDKTICAKKEEKQRKRFRRRHQNQSKAIGDRAEPLTLFHLNTTEWNHMIQFDETQSGV